jgi:TATA-binding protein-associated factor Taf7
VEFESATPMTDHTGTPAGQDDDSAADGDGGNLFDGSDDGDEDGGEGDEMDGDDDEDKADDKQGIREDIARLRRSRVDYRAKLKASTKPAMQKRLGGLIRSLTAEIQLKLSSIGEVEDEEED